MQAVLDITKAQAVTYCIPLWLRDEQISVNTASVKGRIGDLKDSCADDGPVAIACYGPSLNDTWEELRAYKHVMSCSGAHRFLIDKGLVPRWHVDVDPREHKIQLVGEPHKDVEYLIASTCHPKYFDMLAAGGFNVKLWHVFENKEDSFRLLPAGEWALFGGSDAGHRAMVVARFLGFRELHIYGMDGCESEKHGKHAAAHPSQPKGYSNVDFEGRTYRTTPAMLECVRQLKHEVDQLGDAAVTFHGDGLAQATMRGYTPNVEALKGQPSVGIAKPELISATYRDLNAQLHRENLAYGVGGGRHAESVLQLSLRLNSRSVLDYGAGKGYLAKALPFPIWEYDPAIPAKAISPRPADIVICTDVLEHIEPDKLQFVLDDLRRVVLKVGYFVVHTGPAKKTLPDGRNTHLIQKGERWWRNKLARFFEVGSMQQVGMELHIVVGTKRPKAKRAA